MLITIKEPLKIYDNLNRVYYDLKYLIDTNEFESHEHGYKIIKDAYKDVKYVRDILYNAMDNSLESDVNMEDLLR